MSRDTRTAWFLPLRIRDPRQLERWLEAQAYEGWIAERLGFLSAVRMVLVRRAGQRRYRYAIDPRRFPDASQDALIAAAGWEEIGTLAGKDVWRVAYEGARPEFLAE